MNEINVAQSLDGYKTLRPETGALLFLSPARAFAKRAQSGAAENNIELISPQGFINTLIDRQAAMVFIDAVTHEWSALVLGCKNSAATRRIPLCLVSDSAEQRAKAIDCGAEVAISWRELDSQFNSLIAELARQPSPESLKQLECECGQPLPPLAVDGLAQFNAGEFYRQHDLFEELWMESVGPVRDLYRAILQIGVAYYQLERGNYRGALKMLQRSVQWIYHLPPTCQGIDVARLRRDSYHLRAELERLGPARLQELDASLLKPVRWQPPQSPST